ncbi:hypothetical protein [Xanthocytophaga agilis]|uniref:Uncharacterized protein n=1 Tax=Xanthocytophaga agilis TaxID=3048010 RepID=A0AAE3UGN9_9BACT|nr:hypothetical protein [Xanthocytophaga agilis]MDJ1503491.1 hypothetical protein [Xanthocytophaga agilis]
MKKIFLVLMICLGLSTFGFTQNQSGSTGQSPKEGSWDIPLSTILLVGASIFATFVTAYNTSKQIASSEKNLKSQLEAGATNLKEQLKVTTENLYHQIESNRSAEDKKRYFENIKTQKQELKTLFSKFFTMGFELNNSFYGIKDKYDKKDIEFLNSADLVDASLEDYTNYTYRSHIQKYHEDLTNLSYTIRLTLNTTAEQLEIQKVFDTYMKLISGKPDLPATSKETIDNTFADLFNKVKGAVDGNEEKYPKV